MVRMLTSRRKLLEIRGKRLPVLCKGYEPKEIFNVDETGLFFRALPTKSMVTKGNSCNGGKNSKDRITVLLAASAAGEKLRPLVIGKSKKSRCFYGFEIPTLGVDYDYSKKSWMTMGIFTAWLNPLNNRMRLVHITLLIYGYWLCPKFIVILFLLNLLINYIAWETQQKYTYCHVFSNTFIVPPLFVVY